MKTLNTALIILLAFQTSFDKCGRKNTELSTVSDCYTELNLINFNNWEFYSEDEKKFKPGGPGIFVHNSEGLKFYGTSTRYGGRISTKESYDLKNKVIYVKWKVSGGYSFNNYAISLYYDKNIPAPEIDFKTDFNDATTDHSYLGSLLIENDEWYFSKIIINETNAICITSAGNYNDAGGKILRTDHKIIKFTAGWLAIRSGDTYSGKETSVTVAEFHLASMYML